MKTIYKILFSLLLLPALSGCSDFFDASTDDTLSGDKYISETTEAYTGFLGIVTKMQAIGDKAIYLTDTRGELLEPTSKSSPDLISIYNYSDNLDGNEYANPAGYYEVIIACNDYIKNMQNYNDKYEETLSDDVYEGLISSALRIKAWTYLNIAKIYGKAVWFDDPVTEIKDIKDSAVFKVMDLDQVVEKCIDLLDNGCEEFPGIDGTKAFSWYEWLDPDTKKAESTYRYWDYMVPDYAGLYSELNLWAGNYQVAANLLLNTLNESFTSSSSSNVAWLRNQVIAGKWSVFWDNSSPYAYETASAIIYSYTENQTNHLLHTFSNEYPNAYLLKPSDTGMERFSTEDSRGGTTFKEDNSGEYYISKFRPIGSSARSEPDQDDVHIYIYRGSEYHFMLAEAMVGLGRFAEAEALINNGVGSVFKGGESDPVTWKGFTNDWVYQTTMGSRKYYNTGIRGCLGLGKRPFTVVDSLLRNPNTILAAKIYDFKQIANEYLLEFACEGKTYPALIRLARHIGKLENKPGNIDPDVIADRVISKYGADSTLIRKKIDAGGYFVNYDF